MKTEQEIFLVLNAYIKDRSKTLKELNIIKEKRENGEASILDLVNVYDRLSFFQSKIELLEWILDK